MATKQFDDKNFEVEVMQSDQPVMVDFYAQWCGRGKLAAPVVEELATKYEGKLKVGKVDVDESSNTAGKLGVMSIPTVIMFKDGKEVARQVGYGGRDGYEAMIAKHV